MIIFNYENDFSLDKEKEISNWIEKTIISEGFKRGDINYIFCDDAYLHKLNVKYLQHDTYTDIISFDNSDGDIISGDIFISTERVAENAVNFNVSFNEELQRVMIHGILHFLGYNDKTTQEINTMRSIENKYLKLLKH